MLHLILGGAGTGKSHALMEEIRRQADKSRRIFAIVPDQFSFEFDKRLYKILGFKEYNKVEVYSFSKLSQEIFRIYGGSSGIYAEDSVKTALMYLAVKSCRKEGSLSFWEKQAASPRFLPLASEAVKDFRMAGIAPDALVKKLSTVNESVRDKLSDLSMIYTEYNRLLTEKGYKDSLAELGEAAAVASKNNFFVASSVFVDEFRSYTKEEYDLLNAVISSGGDLFATLTLERSETGANSLFSVNQKTYGAMYNIAKAAHVPFEEEWLYEPVRFRNKELSHISTSIFRSKREKINCGGHFSISRFHDPYEEIDFVSGEISRLVREDGYTYGNIAVVSRNLESYSGILESALRRSDIPYFLDSAEALTHKSLTILIMSALKLAAARSFDSEELLKYGKTGLAGVSWEEISLLENYCYKWNVDGDFWVNEFPEGEDKEPERIRKKLVEPLLKLKEACKAASGIEISKSIYAFLQDIGAMSLLEETPAGNNEELLALRELKQLWNMLIHCLDVLAEVLGEEEISLSDYRELLSAVLSGSKYAVPPQTLDAVTLSAAERGRLSNPRAVFVIGMNEGVFPAAVKNTGLFSDRDQAALEEAGMEISFSLKDKVSEESFITYQALSSPSEELYVTLPMADSAGKTQFPSFVTEQLDGLFTAVPEKNENDLIFYSPTKEAAYYQFVRSFQKDSREVASIRSVLEEDEWYKGRITGLDRLSSSKEYRIENKETARKLFGERLTISPSRFEDYQLCPFIYFCKKGLGINAPKKVEMNPAEQGNLIHYCLCEILEGYKKDEFISASFDELKNLVSRAADGYYKEFWGGDFGKTASFSAMLNRVVITITKILARLQEEFRNSDFVPSAFELKIETDGKCKPRTIRSKKGNEIRFVGTIDRVDSFEKDGKTYLRVVDYKSGVKDFALSDLLYGLNMQMLLYLFTVSENEALFKNPVPAGILYMPSKDAAPELLRSGDDDEFKKAENKNYKMKGILLNDMSVLEAMEKDVGGVFLPIRKKAAPKTKKGEAAEIEFTPSDLLFTSAQLERLKAWTDGLLGEMADSLADGRIEASPLKKKSAMPCDYCDYWSICGRNPSAVREYAPDAGDKIKEIIGGEESGGKLD